MLRDAFATKATDTLTTKRAPDVQANATGARNSNHTVAKRTSASSSSALDTASRFLVMSLSTKDGLFFHRASLARFSSRWLALGMRGRGVTIVPFGVTSSASRTCGLEK